MYLLKLCETCLYPPRLLEHWLCTIQKHPRPVEILLLENRGKVLLLTSEDISAHLRGSSSNKCTITSAAEIIKKLPAARICIQQKKGPLLPIKRHGQFEDRINKERIFPMDNLIMEIAKQPNSFLLIRFKPVHDELRRRALKKAKGEHFQPERLFDQWESRAWIQSRLKPSFRRMIGPLIRRAPRQTTRGVQEKTESTHEREDPKAAVLDKLSRPLFKVEMQASTELRPALENFAGGFSIPYLGELKVTARGTRSIRSARSIRDMHRMHPPRLILSAEELASIIAPPNPTAAAPYMLTESTAYLPQPANPMQISDSDRRRHLYVVGKTGMGKSTALLHLFQQDAQLGKTILLMDPHGDLIHDAFARIPQNRHDDTLIIDPSQTKRPIALNPLELQAEENAALKSSALLEIFQALAKGSWGPRLEYILRNALMALTLAPNTTLLDIPRLLMDKTFCKRILDAVPASQQISKDPELQRFFMEEFFTQESRTRQEHIAPILNKIGPLLTAPLLRNIFGQPRGKFDMTKLLNGRDHNGTRKIILINLSKGKLGQDTSNMLGMIFISMLQSLLLARANAEQSDRSTVSVFIDEFQSFATPTLISMLSESRKYGLALTLANQYLTQLPLEIQDAVLGNVGSLLAFRLSYQDAQILAPSLALTEEDLTNLAPFQAYAKVLKDARPLPLFRWNIPPPPTTEDSTSSKSEFDQILNRSMHRFGRQRSFVEEKIRARYNATKQQTRQ